MSKYLTPFYRGYRKMLVQPRLRSRFQLPVIRENIHITAGAGGGKSEIIKLLFYHRQSESQRKRSLGLGIIEPSGKLAKEVLFFNLNKDPSRVIYVSAYLHKLLGEEEQYLPVINPFELKDKTQQNINALSQELAWAFVQIIGASDFTLYMNNVFRFCAIVLLGMEAPTLKNFYDLLSAEEDDSLLQRARNNPNQVVRDFFANEYVADRTYLQTRERVKARLMNVRIDPIFEQMLSGKSTIDLEEAMNAGKIISVA